MAVKVESHSRRKLEVNIDIIYGHVQEKIDYLAKIANKQLPRVCRVQTHVSRGSLSVRHPKK